MMLEYVEGIKLEEFNINIFSKINVDVRFQTMVVHRCQENICSIDTSNAPFGLYQFLQKYKLSNLNLHSSSGIWNEDLWGRQSKNVIDGTLLSVTSEESFFKNTAGFRDLTDSFSHMIGGIFSKATTKPYPLQKRYLSKASTEATVIGETNSIAQYFTDVFHDPGSIKHWLHLLPCTDKAGVGAFVRSDWLYKASHYSLHLHSTLSPRTLTTVSKRVGESTSIQYFNVSVSLSAVITPKDTALHGALLDKLRKYSVSVDGNKTNHKLNTTPQYCSLMLAGDRAAAPPNLIYQRAKKSESVYSDTTKDTNNNSCSTFSEFSAPFFSAEQTESLWSLRDTDRQSNELNGQSNNQQRIPGIETELLSTTTEEEPYVVITSEVRADKGLDFSVANSFHNPHCEQNKCPETATDECKGPTNIDHCAVSLRVVLPLTEHYEILLPTYKYTYASGVDSTPNSVWNDSTSERGDSTAENEWPYSVAHTGLISALPSFHFTLSDCSPYVPPIAFGKNTSIIESISSLYYSSFSPSHLAHNLYDSTLARDCYPTLSFSLTLPPGSTVTVEYAARKRLISRHYQPSDSSRGFTVPPSVVLTEWAILQNSSYGRSEESADRVVTQFTSPLLLIAPIPDLSMPYNVITLVSTLMAFFIGSLVNALLLKRPQATTAVATATSTTITETDKNMG